MDGTIECESLSINQRARFYGQSKPWEDAAIKADASNVVQSFIEPASPPQDVHILEQLHGKS